MRPAAGPFCSKWLPGHVMLGVRMRMPRIERLTLGSFQVDLHSRWAELRGVFEVGEFSLQYLRGRAG